MLPHVYMKKKDFALNLILMFIFAAICVIWTLITGKDANWDLLNYHLYLPYELLDGRLEKDFFAASLQSYLNPIAYIPLYALDKAGLPSWATLSILAVCHSLNLFLLYRISVNLFGRNQYRKQILSCTLGALTIIFWLQVGNTFIDVLTSIPSMLALAILTKPNPLEKRSVIFSGLLFGLATGLKFTNVVIAVPGIIFLYQRPISRSARHAILYILSGIIGLFISYGYWGYQLYKLFGNPVFPLANTVFKSDSFPSITLTNSRYIPQSLAEALRFPFSMTSSDAWVYFENMAPDIRFLVIYALLVPYTYISIRTLKQRSAPEGNLLNTQKLFVLFFVAAYVLWLTTSSNGRYGTPLFLLPGAPLTIACYRLFKEKLARSLILLICIIQAFLLFTTAQTRWHPVEWGSKIIDVHVPATLLQSDNLYLSIESPSNSYIALSLSKNSALINLSGQYRLSLDAPEGRKLRFMLDKYRNSVRTLITDRSNASGDRDWLSIPNSIYAAFGLSIIPTSCERIEVDLISTRKTGLLSCQLTENPPALSKYRQSVADVDRALNNLEAKCPKLLSPTLTKTNQVGNQWQRFYVNTEAQVIVDENGWITVRVPHNFKFLNAGNISHWLGTPDNTLDKLVCNTKRLD